MINRIRILLVLLFVPTIVFGQVCLNESAENIVNNSKKVYLNEKNKTIKFFEIKDNVSISLKGQEEWLSGILRLSNKHTLKFKNEEQDKLGSWHKKYQIYYNGIPVEWNYYIVHYNKGKVTSANGEYILGNDLSIKPQINESNAFEIVNNLVNAKEYHWEAIKAERPIGELVILPLDNTYVLSYKYDIWADEPLFRQYIYIDANSGEILRKIDRIHDADVIGTAETLYNGNVSITTDSNNGTYRLRESSRGSGIETYNMNKGTNYVSATDFTDTDNYWSDNTNNDKAAYDAHYATEATYDYYYSRFNRNSYDNNGAKMISYIHYDVNYVNAFWNGSFMTYGDGNGTTYLPLTPIEVVAHEITHGVIEHSSNLVYAYESGALNESFADIFGVAIDFFKNPSTANFLMGDAMSVTHTPFRSMQNPNEYGDPDTYLGNFWVTGSADNGGVHSNSGVQNFWFYLLCNGGTGTNDLGNTYIINGIGMEKATAIAYRNMSVYLTPSSNYNDARFYSIQSAIDIYGECSSEVVAVTNAWYAVGVGTLFSNSVISDFIASQTNVCNLDSPVYFYNRTINGNTYQWNFGDGSTSTLQNPSHTYATNRSYTVTLVSTGDVLCNNSDSEVKTNYITINSGQSPVPPSCIPRTIHPGTSGIYRFSLNTINNTTNGSIQDYQDFTCTYQTALTEGRFYDLNMTVGSGRPENVYIWIDFNNNGEFGDPNELVYKQPDIKGNLLGNLLIPKGVLYNSLLRLRVGTDSSSHQLTNACTNSVYGQYHDYSITLSSNTLAPEADFICDKVIGLKNEVVSFSDNSQNLPSTWQWSFPGGNPSSSNQQYPQVTYADAGTYDVTLTVTNSNGSNSITKTGYIRVVDQLYCTTNLGGGGCPGDISAFSITGTYFNSINHSNCSNDNSSSYISFPSYGSTTTTLEKGMTYELNVTTNNLDIVSTWIDYNQNGIFESSEWNQITTNSTPNIPSSVNVLIPSTALVGPTGLRIRSRMSGNSNGSTDACSQFGSGITEDYIITIVNPTPAIPVANFSARQIVTLNEDIQFSDLTSGVPTSWLWSFPGGAASSPTSTLQNPTISYNAEGDYSVTLTATNALGTHTTTKTNYISVIKNDYCKSDLGGGGSCPGDITALSILGTTLNNINHSNCSTDNSSTYGSYPATGNTTAELTKDYTYTLSVTTSTSDIISVWIDYNQNGIFETTEWAQVTTSSTPGVASAVNIKIPLSAIIGQTCMRIRSREEGNPNGSADACSLFGSGITEDYIVTIVAPIPAVPVANFSAKQNVLINEVVQFSDLSSGVPTSWLWTFSGGASSISTSSLRNPQVSYSAAGIYTVSLTATNALGTNTTTKTDYITVMAALPGENCLNSQDLSTLTSPYNGTTNGYKNDFSICNIGSTRDRVFYIDVPAGKRLMIGQTTNTFDSRHTLRVNGSCPGTTEMVCTDDPDIQNDMYINNTLSTVRAYYIIGGFSSTDFGEFTLEWSITNQPAPIAEFSADQTTISPGTTINFTDQCSNTPTSWLWTFSGGNTSISTSTLRNPSVTYNTEGVYTVSLTATNSGGSNTITKVDYITVSKYNYCKNNLGGNCPGNITALSIAGTTLNNTTHSICNYSNGSAYGFYPPLANNTASLYNGTNYQLSVTTSNNNIISVWIDYNQNGVFETNEWTQVALSSIPGTASVVSVNIPASALVGQTGMRIRSRSSGNPNGPTDVCSYFGSGMTEDYMITILPKYFVYVSTNAIAMGALPNSTNTFSITSNVNWNVVSDQTWLAVSNASGNGNSAITITALSATSVPRTANITISADGLPSRTITVTQTLPTLNISTNSLNLSAAASSTNTFSITSNVNWTVVSDQSWLSVSNASGDGNRTIMLTATFNSSAAARYANVIVSGINVNAQTVAVTQTGSSTGVEELGSEQSATLYPNPSRGQFMIELCNFKDEVNIGVTNSLGSIVKKIVVKNLSSTYNQEIDLKDMADGIYFISIQSNKTRIVKTLVKINH